MASSTSKSQVLSKAIATIGRVDFVEASSDLLAAKQRTALALTGIVIGIASISSMISIGSIVRAEAVREFKQLGTEIVNIRVRARDRESGRVSIRLEDAERVVNLPSFTAVAPYVEGSAPAVLAGTSATTVRIVGATPKMMELNRLELAEGRFVSSLDERGFFCTIGASLATELRNATQGSVIGESIRIGNGVYTVVGTLRHASLGRRPFDPNTSVFLPLNAAMRVVPTATLRDILARMSPAAHYREADQQVVEYFRLRIPDAHAQVRSAEELIEQMHRQLRLYTLLLGAVAGISLLVGGIGVMNVMLIAVSERKSEIAVRRALGARRRDIQAQFITESVLLSLIGGVIGIFVAFVATYAICHFAGWEFSVSIGGTALGACVAGSAGVFFGFYPAYQAARLDPALALTG